MLTVDTYAGVINQLLPEPHAGLLAGILFGVKTSIPKDFYEALLTTGTLHIIALSGMNISILESIIAVTMLHIVPRRIAATITIVLIIGFVWFVGVGASVVRAAIMGSLALFAVIFGRQTWGFFSFFLTVGIMLLMKPSWLGDLSFQLSALATLGLILFGGKLSSQTGPADGFLPSDVLVPPNDNLASKVNHPHDYSQVAILGQIRTMRDSGRSTGVPQPSSPAVSLLKFLYSLISDDLRTTLAAQVFTIPLILFTFRRVSMVSPLTNVLIGWVIPPLTAIGLVTVIVGWIFLPMAYVFAWVDWVFLEYLILAISWTAKLPFSGVSW